SATGGPNSSTGIDRVSARCSKPCRPSMISKMLQLITQAAETRSQIRNMPRRQLMGVDGSLVCGRNGRRGMLYSGINQVPITARASVRSGYPVTLLYSGYSAALVEATLLFNCALSMTYRQGAIRSFHPGAVHQAIGRTGRFRGFHPCGVESRDRRNP